MLRAVTRSIGRLVADFFYKAGSRSSCCGLPNEQSEGLRQQRKSWRLLLRVAYNPGSIWQESLPNAPHLCTNGGNLLQDWIMDDEMPLEDRYLVPMLSAVSFF